MYKQPKMIVFCKKFLERNQGFQNPTQDGYKNSHNSGKILLKCLVLNRKNASVLKCCVQNKIVNYVYNILCKRELYSRSY